MDDAAYERKVLVWLDKVRQKPQGVTILRKLLWFWAAMVLFQILMVVGDFVWDRDYRIDPWGTFFREGGAWRIMFWGLLFAMQWLAYQQQRTLVTVARILDRERDGKRKPVLEAPGAPPRT